ncbi:hypothetical protein VTO42DRAFT_2586 [Malbranchea cinnamomea]
MSLDPLSLSAAAGLATASAAYLNARFGIGADLRNVRAERDLERRVLENVRLAGDTCTLYALFARGAQRNPAREALWFEGRRWTYEELKSEVDRLAAFLHAHDVKPASFVAVFMSNTPEMVVSILALSKLGAVAALLNTNLRDDTLRHCLGVAGATTVLSTPELADAIASVLSAQSSSSPPTPHFVLNFGSFASSSSSSSSSSSAAPASSVSSITDILSLSSLPPASSPAVTSLGAARAKPTDLACLIYTSGTTGHPKACGIRNFQMYVTATPHSQDLRSPRRYLPLRTYSALPLFHGTCLFTGLCQTLGGSGAGGGGTFCLARKFSASRFFADVVACRATRILYVGELCRYLLATPASPHDRAHAVLVANGNGLRREIWEAFKARFGIPEIREFYRSTEGLGKFDNFGPGCWGAGRLGFVGPLRRRWLERDTFIVRVDADTGDVHRDPRTGFCVRCGPGEPGEVIGRIKARELLTEYLGNEEATRAKLLFDVFEKGDAFQRMGDLCLVDRDGWVHFHDRVGDTFRWKGENVSAGEVRDHIAALPGVADALVYGVKLPAYDGKAGGAAISLSSRSTSGTVSSATTASADAFMNDLYGALRKTGVPDYAVPRLVRITKEISTGVTFKQAKRDFEKKSWVEGDHGDSDVLYWLNGKKYERLKADAWAAIEAGKAKL